MIYKFIKTAKGPSQHFMGKNLPVYNFTLSTIDLYPDLQNDPNNYYRILGVRHDATLQQINKAYKDLGRDIDPDNNPVSFKRASEAFVILSNHKSRDAYDSLLKSRKTSFINDPQIKVSTPIKPSYLAERKMAANEKYKKMFNLDEFGRYKGGLPKKVGPYQNSKHRGNAEGQIGTLHRVQLIDNQNDMHPQYTRIDSQKKSAFQNFHQDQREARTMRWTWYSMQVQYNFFTFKSFRKNYWPYIKLFVLLGYVLPTFYHAYDYWQRNQKYQQIKNGKK